MVAVNDVVLVKVVNINEVDGRYSLDRVEKADNATHSNLDKARAALAQNREREKNRTARDYLGLALLTDYLSVNKEGSFLASGLEWRGGVTAPP